MVYDGSTVECYQNDESFYYGTGPTRTGNLADVQASIRIGVTQESDLPQSVNYHNGFIDIVMIYHVKFGVPAYLPVMIPERSS